MSISAQLGPWSVRQTERGRQQGASTGPGAGACFGASWHQREDHGETRGHRTHQGEGNTSCPRIAPPAGVLSRGFAGLFGLRGSGLRPALVDSVTPPRLGACAVPRRAAESRGAFLPSCLARPQGRSRSLRPTRLPTSDSRRRRRRLAQACRLDHRRCRRTRVGSRNRHRWLGCRPYLRSHRRCPGRIHPYQSFLLARPIRVLRMR